jgi:diaminopimelate decarboxylase
MTVPAEWHSRVSKAVAEVGTPAYISAWSPVDAARARLRAIQSRVPVRSWLSFKTHPLPALARRWIRTGGGVEIVSEHELAIIAELECPVDQLLVNGVAKHSWLRHLRVRGMRVHFDSAREVDLLLDRAVSQQWRVGVRLHAPDEHDAHDPRFQGQFGLDRGEAIRALRQLTRAGAFMESVHFHLGQSRHHRDAYTRAVEWAADVCDEAGFAPAFVDCGGGLPAADDETFRARCDGLAEAFHLAARRFPLLREIWLEHGRFMTSDSCVLAMTVLDVKERPECRYLICDGGRTNHALAADAGPHPLMMLPDRAGEKCLTTICGPTCMTDDRLGRWLLPDTITVGDVIVWMNAGAYHLPWETQFSHGLCAIVWFDNDEAMSVVRARQKEPAWTVAS